MGLFSNYIVQYRISIFFVTPPPIQFNLIQ